MADKLDGSCLCGAVRYTIEGQPLAVVTCHCRNCQKQSGSAFSVVVAIRREALTLYGELGRFEDVGTSGDPVYRRFCQSCGSPVLTETPRASADGLVFVKGGTIDNAENLLTPTIHYWTERQHGWLELPEAHLRLGREEAG